MKYVQPIVLVVLVWGSIVIHHIMCLVSNNPPSHRVLHSYANKMLYILHINWVKHKVLCQVTADQIWQLLQMWLSSCKLPLPYQLHFSFQLDRLSLSPTHTHIHTQQHSFSPTEKSVAPIPSQQTESGNWKAGVRVSCLGQLRHLLTSLLWR